MTELSFLIDLLMNHKLPKVTKQAIAARIKEVEARLPALTGYKPAPQLPHSINQAPSTIALMEKQAEMNPQVAMTPVIPVEQIAQTPAAQQALLDRQRKMLGAGKIDNKLERPPKF